MNDKDTAKLEKAKQISSNNENIVKYIKNRGLKMTEVAKGIGVDKVSFAQYLRGDMSVTKIQKIADFLECSIDELLKGEQGANTLICPHCGQPLHIDVS